MNARFHKIDIGIAVLGIMGLVVFLMFFDKAFPTASVNLRISNKQALQIAREYLEKQKFDLQGYYETVIFSEDGIGMTYLQRTLGMDQFNRLARDLPLRYWEVRFFKELQHEEFTAWVNPHGRVISFLHSIPEEAKGAGLEQKEALSIARSFIEQQEDVSLAQYALADTSTKKRDNRTDHSFAWEALRRDLAEGKLRISITIHGNVVDLFDQSLKVPEKFTEAYKTESSKGAFLASLSISVLFLLVPFAIVILLTAHKKQSIPWKGPLVLAMIISTVSLLADINAFPIHESAYLTDSPLYTFWGNTALEITESALWMGVVILVYAIAGWAACSEVFKGNRMDYPTRRQLWFSPELGYASFMGYTLAFINIGYVTAFYLIGEKYWGVWSPVHSDYSNMLGTWLPFFNPLSTSIQAAVLEELIFRFFAITLLMRFMKVKSLALLIPAMIWGFAHSNYAVFPFYTRGIELTIYGLVIGYFFIRYGLITVIVAHFVYDAIMIGMPLFLSSSLYFLWSGIAVAGVMAIPMMLGIIGMLRDKITVLAGKVATPHRLR